MLYSRHDSRSRQTGFSGDRPFTGHSALTTMKRILLQVSCYITVYEGPPEPSGTVHSMFCSGSLMSHALQCRQF